MEGKIYDAGGKGWRLPELLHWEICHGFCTPCDSFEAAFPYAPEMRPALEAACRFRAEAEGKTVFYGVIDETELTAEPEGCTAVLRGRGMQALLMDSQAERCDYASAGLNDILERHAALLEPDGIVLPETDGGSCAFSVREGESHWSVLRRYAAECAGLRPRFAPDGRLILDGGDSGRQFRLDGATAVLAQRYTQERYGVRSAVRVVNRTLGRSYTAENTAFQAMGGQSVSILSVPRGTDAETMRRRGELRLRESAAELRRCSLTLAECFAAFPGDRILLEQTPLGITGRYRVESSRSFAGARGAGTVLELRPENEMGGTDNVAG